MGVLRVNDGTALLPDWRNVGCGGAAGSGFTAVTDSFNRANSTTTLGSPWTVVSQGGGGSPAWGISSNQAYCAASYIDGFGTVHSTLAYLDVGSGDVDITVTLAVPSNGNGVLLRLSATTSFFIVNSNDITWVSGGGSVLHTHSSGFSSGDVMRVLAVGSSIQVFKNGVSVNSITDTRNQTATRHGMVGDAVFAPSMRLDDFTIAPGVTATTGRLKLWDGTRWMREACDNDPSITITDNANRANSTTTPNPCSDGGAWTVKGGPWGINTNRLYPVTRSGGSPVINGSWDAIMRNTGLVAADVTITNTMTAAGIPALNGIVFASNAAGSDCLYLSWDGTGNSGGFGVFTWNGTVQSTIGTQFSIGTPWANTGSGPVIRVTYAPTTGVVNVYKNGTLMGSRTYTGPAKTGTWVGPIVNRLGASGDVYTFDDFAATAAPERHPLRIEDPSSPGTWIDVACMTPA